MGIFNVDPPAVARGKDSLKSAVMERDREFRRDCRIRCYHHLSEEVAIQGACLFDQRGEHRSELHVIVELPTDRVTHGVPSSKVVLEPRIACFRISFMRVEGGKRIAHETVEGSHPIGWMVSVKRRRPRFSKMEPCSKKLIGLEGIRLVKSGGHWLNPGKHERPSTWGAMFGCCLVRLSAGFDLRIRADPAMPTEKVDGSQPRQTARALSATMNASPVSPAPNAIILTQVGTLRLSETIRTHALGRSSNRRRIRPRKVPA